MPSLLRPPSHRGPLIAAGTTVLTAGVAIQQLRIDDLPAGWQTLITGGLAVLVLWLSVGAPLEGGRPPAYQSVLTVCGLLLLAAGLLNLADALGAEFASGVAAGTGVWTSAVLALVATLLAVRRNSGIAALIAASAAAGVLLFGAEWVSDPETAAFRWLLLLLALVFAVLSLVLRAGRPRQSEQLVNAAGVAILAIPMMVASSAFFGVFLDGETELLPGFWEVVVLGAGFGLVAYAAADRAPGPAYLGFANLLAFVLVTSAAGGRTLEWWPLTLLVLGGLMLAAGLRPARPLPPEPEGYRRDDLPLTARVEDGERVFDVRD